MRAPTTFANTLTVPMLSLGFGRGQGDRPTPSDALSAMVGQDWRHGGIDVTALVGKT
jgi:hypothetical protein